MRLPHLLAVHDPPAAFATLLAALSAAGQRCGWLDLATAPVEPPPALAETAGLGLLRAVAVGPGLAVAAKPLRGAPVLRDLLREHFLGCAVVLVRGGEPYPALRPDAEKWRLELAGGRVQLLELDALVARLRRPRPFD